MVCAECQKPISGHPYITAEITGICHDCVGKRQFCSRCYHQIRETLLVGNEMYFMRVSVFSESKGYRPNEPRPLPSLQFCKSCYVQLGLEDMI